MIYELLGQHASAERTLAGNDGNRQSARSATPDPEPVIVPTAARPRVAPANRSRAGAALAGVKAFIGERVSPADGERVEMKALVREYRAWCADKGSGPVDLESFLEEVEKVCRKVGIEIVNDAQRVVCLNVKIDAVDNVSALH